MNFRSEVGGEAQHTDPPGGSLEPPHKILKVVSRISAYMLPQMAPPVRHPPQPPFLNNSPDDVIYCVLLNQLNRIIPAK